MPNTLWRPPCQWCPQPVPRLTVMFVVPEGLLPDTVHGDLDERWSGHFEAHDHDDILAHTG